MVDKILLILPEIETVVVRFFLNKFINIALLSMGVVI